MNSPPYATMIVYGIVPNSLTINTNLLKAIKSDTDSDLYYLILNNTKYIIKVLQTDKKIGFVISKGDLYNND